MGSRLSQLTVAWRSLADTINWAMMAAHPLVKVRQRTGSPRRTEGTSGGSSPERLQRVPERGAPWSKSRALKHWGTGAMCPSTVTAAGRVDKCHVVQLIGSCS